MCQKLDTNAKIGLASASGEICTCANWVKSFWLNVDPDKLICLLVLNLKMPITKLELHLELQKTICYKISQWCHYQSDLQNPNSATNDRITFHLCSYSKLVSPIIFISPKKSLKSYKKCLLCHLNFSFGSCNIQILGGNQEVENEIIMTSWNWFCKLLTLIYEKTWKTTLN